MLHLLVVATSTRTSTHNQLRRTSDHLGVDLSAILKARKILFCCRVSHEKMTPFRTIHPSGNNSSRTSTMKTRRAYNLMLWRFSLSQQNERYTAGHKQQRTKLKLALNAELLHRQVASPSSETDLSNDTYLIRHILRLSHSWGFVLVELLPPPERNFYGHRSTGRTTTRHSRSHNTLADGRLDATLDETAPNQTFVVQNSLACLPLCR